MTRIKLRYLTVDRELSRTRGTLERYVSPQLVRYVMDNLDSIRFDGQKRKLTVFFSDLAGFTALSERLGATLPYDTLSALRAKLFADHPTFGQIDFAPGSVVSKPDLTKLGGKAKAGKGAFAPSKRAFHLTNPIARASVTMAECAGLAAGQHKHAAE